MAQQLHDDLVGSAIDVVVQHGLIIKVNVTVDDEEDDKHERTKTFLLPPDTRIANLKRLLAKEWCIPEEEQRLYFYAQEDNHNNKPLVGGTLEDVNQVEMDILLQRQHLDSRLKSLFDIVGLEQWEERDIVMNLMIKERNAKQCYNQHTLIEMENYKAVSREASYICAGCHIDFCTTTRVNRVRMKPFVCACRFCLCTRCFSRDEGSAREEDPYQALQTVALEIGQKMALSVTFDGRQQSHVLYRFECAPQVFIDGRGQRSIRPTTKVLPDGIRLQIRFSNEARDFLVENGFESSMSQFEIDEVRDQGATFEDAKNLRQAWVRNRVYGIYDALSNERSSRFPHYRTLTGDRAQPYATTKLICYTLEEVVYEVGVQIDDGEY